MSNISWEDEFIEKWDNGERDIDIIDTIIECEFEREIVGESRWFNEVVSTAEINGRYFQVKWYKPKSEYGDCEYPSDPIEVKKVIKQVKITVYEPIED